MTILAIQHVQLAMPAGAWSMKNAGGLNPRPCRPPFGNRIEFMTPRT